MERRGGRQRRVYAQCASASASPNAHSSATASPALSTSRTPTKSDLNSISASSSPATAALPSSSPSAYHTSAFRHSSRRVLSTLITSTPPALSDTSISASQSPSPLAPLSHQVLRPSALKFPSVSSPHTVANSPLFRTRRSCGVARALYTNRNARDKLSSICRLLFGSSLTFRRVQHLLTVIFTLCSIIFLSYSHYVAHYFIPRINFFSRKTLVYPPPTLHIFAAPKPFFGKDALNQLRALRSWTSLKPRPFVTLLTCNATAKSTRHYLRAAAFLSAVSIRTVSSTFRNIPLFPAVLRAAYLHSAKEASVTVLVNADIVLYQDIVEALSRLTVVMHPQTSWLAIGARWDVSEMSEITFLSRERSRQNGTLHTFGGIDLWAWNVRKDVPLLNMTTSSSSSSFTSIPSFAIGRGTYDNWFTHEAIVSAIRKVIDISHAATLAHVRHDHHLVQQLERNSATASSSNRFEYWTSLAGLRVRFEAYVNAHLAFTTGTFRSQLGTILYAPFKLIRCAEPTQFCLVRRRRPGTCRCEYSPFVKASQSDPYVINGSRTVFCGLQSADNVRNAAEGEGARQDVQPDDRWPISGHVAVRERHAPYGLPLTKAHALSNVLKDPVVLIVAAAPECALLKESVCAIRRVGAFERIVVAAVDDEMYACAITNGFAAYLEEDVSDAALVGTRQLEAARLRITAAVLETERDVLAVAPGTLMLQDASTLYASIAQGVDLAFWNLEGGKKWTSSIFYAKGNVNAQRFLRNAASEYLRGNNRSLGSVLEDLACGAAGEWRTANGICERKHKSAVKVTRMQTGFVRSLGKRFASIPRDAVAVTLRDLDTPEQKLRWLTDHGWKMIDEAWGVCKDG